MRHGQWYVDNAGCDAKVYTDGLQRMLTVVSPWQWFCSTRTFSNCLETTLTVVALYFWPWRWTIAPQNNKSEDEDDDDLITNSDMNEEPEERNESGRYVVHMNISNSSIL